MRQPSVSRMRPVSTNRPRNSRPSVCRCQPNASPCRSKLERLGLRQTGSRADAPVRSRNHSGRGRPARISTAHASGSCGSPKSRWMVSTARATSTTLSGGQETNDIGQPREGRLVAVAAPHAAAGREVVSRATAARVRDGDETAAVRENVHVVQGRDGEADLEFPRQVGFAVERVHEILVRRRVEVELDALNPDRVIGRGARGERRRPPAGRADGPALARPLVAGVTAAP